MTASWDGIVRVWDANTGEQVLYYTLGNAPVGYADWSPDGHSILVGGLILPTWNTLQELIDYAHECCVVRPLTPEERELFGLPPLEE